MISLKVIRIDELITFSSNKTIDGKLCITKQKAISIVNNPCAENKDVSLVTAWHNGDCVAFLGVLPNHILDNEKAHKIYWMSSFYTAPNYQGKGIGTRLMNELKKENIDIYSSHRLTGTYIKANFKDFGYLKYKIIDFNNFRTNFNKPFFRRPLLKMSIFNRNKLIYQSNKFDFINIYEFGSEFEQFVKKTTFLNSIKHYNWILKFPWVFSKDEVEKSTYIFSYQRNFFKHFAFEIRNNNRLIGGVLFYISKNENQNYLQICNVLGKFDLKELEIFIIKKCKEYKIDVVKCNKELFKHKFVLNTIIDKRYYVGFSHKKNKTFKFKLTFMDGDRQLY